MDISSQLNKMTTEEKLQTMELLWDDLCQASDFSSPDWHKNVLDDREKRLKEGNEEILDWTESKLQLRDSLP